MHWLVLNDEVVEELVTAFLPGILLGKFPTSALILPVLLEICSTVPDIYYVFVKMALKGIL